MKEMPKFGPIPVLFSSRRRHTRLRTVTGVQTWLFRSTASLRYDFVNGPGPEKHHRGRKPARNGRKSRPASLTIRLNLQEVECLLLADWSARLLRALPIGNRQTCCPGFRSKNFPVIADANGNLG